MLHHTSLFIASPFLHPRSFFVRNLLRHVTFHNTFYICIYIIHVTLFYIKAFMSNFVFYKISTSILQFFIRFWRHFLQFLSRLALDSTTFTVTVSHLLFSIDGLPLSVFFNIFFLIIIIFMILKQFYPCK